MTTNKAEPFFNALEQALMDAGIAFEGAKKTISGYRMALKTETVYISVRDASTRHWRADYRVTWEWGGFNGPKRWIKIPDKPEDFPADRFVAKTKKLLKEARVDHERAQVARRKEVEKEQAKEKNRSSSRSHVMNLAKALGEGPNPYSGVVYTSYGLTIEPSTAYADKVQISLERSVSPKVARKIANLLKEGETDR